MNKQTAASWQESNGSEHLMPDDGKQGLPSSAYNPPVSGEFLRGLGSVENF